MANQVFPYLKKNYFGQLLEVNKVMIKHVKAKGFEPGTMKVARTRANQ